MEYAILSLVLASVCLETSLLPNFRWDTFMCLAECFYVNSAVYPSNVYWDLNYTQWGIFVYIIWVLFCSVKCNFLYFLLIQISLLTLEHLSCIKNSKRKCWQNLKEKTTEFVTIVEKENSGNYCINVSCVWVFYENHFNLILCPFILSVFFRC